MDLVSSLSSDLLGCIFDFIGEQENFLSVLLTSKKFKSVALPLFLQKTNYKGLFFACTRGYEDYFFSNLPKNKKWKPQTDMLIAACKLGSVRIVRELIENRRIHVAVKRGISGRTAARNGNVEVLEYLIQRKGFDINCAHLSVLRQGIMNEQKREVNKHIIRLIIDHPNLDKVHVKWKILFMLF